MKGYWFFLACAALCGSSISIGIPWLLILLFHLIWLRILLIKKRKLILYVLIIYGIFTLIGFWTNHHHKSVYDSSQKNFLITFINTPTIDGNLVKSIVNTGNNEKLALNYKIKTEEEKVLLSKSLQMGLSCNVKGELLAPENNRNENLFNYKLYLSRKNIYWIFNVDSFLSCKNEDIGLLGKLRKVREKGLANIEKLYSKQLVPYAKALLFGDNSGFSEETYSLYQRLGVVHLLAISGLHVGIISAGIFFLFIRIGLTRESSSYCLLMLLPLYALLSGGNPPVVRAVIMSMILITSMHWKLPFTSLDALSISFLLFLLKDPYIVFNVGFQLSYAVSLSILLSAKTIIPRYNSFLAKIIVVSFISQISSLPILSHSFFEISIISVISNIVFVPLYSFFVLPAFLLSFLISFISLNVFSFFDQILSCTILFSEGLGHVLDINFAVLITGKPGICLLLLMLISAIITLKYWENGVTFLKMIIPIVVAVTFVIISQLYNPFGEVTFIDVGQGDSILIRLPFHRGTYLIDTGGQMNYEQQNWMKKEKPFQISQDILIPFFKSKGIRTIDKLILTHSDADHIGAAQEIMGNIKISQINITPNSWEKPLMVHTLETAQQYDIPIKVVKSGSKWKNDSGSFQFIYPFDNDYEGNNDSLVLYADVGGKTWLFTGDIEKQSEEEIIKHYSFKTDVLKVGHHGSKTSSSKKFIEQLHPRYAIISAGKNNRFGHPHQEALQVLNENKVKIFRTDQNGAVTYKFFRNYGTFKTILP